MYCIFTNSNNVAMKQLYRCLRDTHRLSDLMRVTLSIMMVVMFVLNGTAANSYNWEEGTPSNRLSDNVGSSVDNLLKLSIQLNTIESNPQGIVSSNYDPESDKALGLIEQPAQSSFHGPYPAFSGLASSSVKSSGGSCFIPVTDDGSWLPFVFIKI